MAGEIAEIVHALPTLSTSDIARSLGVSPTALRSALQRHGVSIRGERQSNKPPGIVEGVGISIRRSTVRAGRNLWSRGVEPASGGRLPLAAWRPGGARVLLLRRLEVTPLRLLLRAFG